MDDLGNALTSEQPINMLGGGNPARIDTVNQTYWSVFKTLAEGDMGSMAIENIETTNAGDAKFIAALVDFFNRHYDWGLTTDNIALTNGSQNAFLFI